MDGTELDEIMNGDVTPDVIEQTAVPETATQPRDETGKFAPKADELTTEVSDNDAQAAVEGDKRVPVAAVQAEREKARTERDRANDLERRLAEMQGQLTVLTQQRQQPQTLVEKAKPKSFWENPDEFLSERLAPVQQTVQQQRFEMSRMLADEKFGADVVKAADDALGERIKANDPTVAAFQAQIANSRHPYADLVKWHEKQKAMADIGDDPAAFREREREAIRAELMAEMGVQPNPNPSTTTKPLIKLPQSLNKLPGAGNGNGGDDLSDAGIFTHAMGGR